MLAGVTARWKQAVAYHFAAGTFDAFKVLKMVFDVLRRSEDLGLSVDCDI
ncbi:unnamed protein product [Ixodes pacificus]